MKLTVLPILFLATSCATFGQTPSEHLALIQQAAVASRMTIRPVIDRLCADEARRCAEENVLVGALFRPSQSPEEECPGLAMCDQVRTIIINTLQALQYAIVDANTALAIGSEERFDAAVQQAAALLIEVREQLAILGVVPE